MHRNLLPAPAQLGQLPAVSAELLPGRRRRRAAETTGARRRVAGGGAAGLGDRSRRSSRSVRHVPGPARQQVLRRFRLPRGVLRHRVARRRHQSMRSAALRRRGNRLPPMRCRRLLLTTNALKNISFVECFLVVVVTTDLYIKYSRFITCQPNTSKGRGRDRLPN